MPATLPLTHLQQPSQNKLAELKKSERRAFEQLSGEEQASVYETMKSWLTMPFDLPDPTMRLYIEQQLSSLTGYSVTSENGELALPVLQTVMSAMPHIKRSPQDVLMAHLDNLEAELARDRSFFGWVNNLENQTDSIDNSGEKYGVYLPFHLLPQWQTQRDQLISGYKKVQVLVCNPFTKKLVVAACIGWWPPSPSHPTSGGTPELITTAQVWHPSSLGKVVIFFISADNPDHALNLGPINTLF